MAQIKFLSLYTLSINLAEFVVSNTYIAANLGWREAVLSKYCSWGLRYTMKILAQNKKYETLTNLPFLGEISSLNAI